MIVILGESASGKSSIERVLHNKYGYKRIISYTTRPPRDGEVDGIDYYFVTVNEFNELNKINFFAEIGCYRGWYYGTPKNECTDDKVAVVTPSGFRQLKKNSDLNIISFYINIPRRDRLIKLLERDSDIDECCRRSLSDVGQFDGIENEVDHVIFNEDYVFSPETIAATINNIITERIG